MTNNNMYFIANWKMFGSVNSVNSLNKVISYSKTKKLKANIIYCPPYTLIKHFVDKTKNSSIEIGAQDCHAQPNYGPFTGGISSKMIKDLGGKFVIIGHSETRKENVNKKINLKIKSALSEKLNVILCIGEKLIDKKKNNKYISMLKKKKGNNKKNKQSTFAKLSIFQPNKYKYKKSCPLSVKGAPVVDYKNIKLLKKYTSENGKILPSRITNISQKKQRELSLSIKRARNLALI